MSGEIMDYKPVLIGGLAVVLLLELVGFFIEIPWFAGLMLAVGIFGLIGWLLRENYPRWEIIKIATIIALIKIVFDMALVYYLFGGVLEPGFFIGMAIGSLIIANFSALLGAKIYLSTAKQKSP